MKKIVLLALSSFLCLSIYAQASYSYSKLPVDTTIKTGRLSNGMTYFIKHHENPKERGEFFIVHNVGALQENDNQNGLAHFLEHLAFNGTKNFPGKTMLDYLNKIGVRFGYNVNAYTSKERTVYNISNVPLARETVLDSVLLMIYDWSGNILCTPEEIEKERGVIREEWRRGDDVRSRMMKQTYALQFKGSKYALRDVIGDTAVVNNFKPETLTDFYHKWYRPDLQAVVIVGDFDTEKMLNKVKALFSKIPAAVNPAPKEQFIVPDFEKPLVGIISDPETRAKGVKIIFKHNGPNAAQKLTTESVEQSIIASLVSNLIQSKMELTKNAPNPPFTTAVAVAQGGSANKWFFQLTMSPVGNDYARALKGTFTDIERIKEYGFSQSDLDLAKIQMIKKIDNNSKKLTDLKSADFVPIIVENFTDGQALIHPAARLNVEKEILNSITVEKVNASLGKILSDENRIIIVNCPQSDLSSVPSEKDILTMSESAKNEILTPFTSSTYDKNFYNFDNLKGSKIVKEVKNEKYQASEWTLSNGIKVYWTQTDDPQANYYINAESPGGLVKVEPTDVASAKMLRNAARYKNLGKLSENETKMFLSTKNAGVSFDLNLYNERVSGSASKNDFELMMQMFYLAFNGLDLQKEGFEKMVKRQTELFEKDPSDNTKFIDSVQFIKYNSSLTRQIKQSEMTLVSLDKMKKVYNERFGNALDFKFFISGPESAETIKPLIEKYIGSLIVNKNLEQVSDGGVYLKKGQTKLKFYTKSIQTPISSINILYYGKAAYTAKNFIASNLLKHILTDRYLKSIREEKGGTYYVGVDANLMSEPQNRLSLEINFDTDPKMREELLKIIDFEIQDIVKNGPASDEFDAALLFIKKSFSDASERKGYLSDRYRNLISDGVDLKDGTDQIFKTIKPADVKNLAAELIKQENKMLFVFGTE